MNLPTEIFGDVVVVHAPPEELAGEQAEPFKTCLTHQERCNVVLDLDNSESITGEGLEALLDCQDLLRQQSGDLKIATMNAVNRKMMEITRLDQQLEVFDNVIDAVKSFR